LDNNIILLTGIFSMIIMALGIILFVVLYQRRVIAHQLELKKMNEERELELIQASIKSEEEERNRIASNLHDDVVATLSSARLFLYKTKDAGWDEEKINHSKELLDESIMKIRDISHKLQPVILQQLGLELALQSLIETINHSGVIKGKFLARRKLPKIEESKGLCAYRICQELITNIIKHSTASNITLETDFEKEGIIITLNYDGIGMTQQNYEDQIYKKGSTGLKNIVNRLKSVNATIQFSKSGEIGYKTIIIIPVLI